MLPSILLSRGQSIEDKLHDKIMGVAESLLKEWCLGLYAQQMNNPGDPSVHGGIYSPGDRAILGRCADSIVPFLWMAAHTREEKYVTAAKKVYAWEQANCSSADGAWFNAPGKATGWKGITVFAAITKFEALSQYSELLGEQTVEQWRGRLHQAAEYLFRTFHIDYANINYPATATYALFQLGRMFDEEKYITKAAELAEGMENYFTPEGLLWGEGGPSRNEHGQFPVDLGYNVEESLQALALYSRLSNNDALLGKVVRSLRVHLEFMLPNGGWDNSWGTRNFKWTLWGSRTSDGCHPGFYLCADKDPSFAEAVYRNLQCLETSTHGKILASGPHEPLAGVTSSIHHTFEHAKALTKLLHTAPPAAGRHQEVLPREIEYGIKKYDSINTVLFSKGPWRGTVTGYNYLYKGNSHDGHCSGGALSCLYHMDFGMVSVASMTRYQRWESQNMLAEEDVKHFMCLTPRLELLIPGEPAYRNISDHQARIATAETNGELRVSTTAKLVTGEQDQPDGGSPEVSIAYVAAGKFFSVRLSLSRAPGRGTLTYCHPVVCSGEDEVAIKGNRLTARTERGSLSVESSHQIQSPIPASERGYNFVPGLQVYPLQIDCSNLGQNDLVLRFSVERQG
jgi:hypothetical protein